MKPKVIELTGGIGSGKSQVRQILSQMGFTVIDCDLLAKTVADLPQVTKQVEWLLGSKAITPEGKLERSYIRSVVFANAELTKQYTAIFTKQVADLLQKEIQKDTSDKEAIFVEVSVPDSLNYPFYAVWVVTAPDEERIRRVVLRDGVSRQNVLDIMSRQTDYCDKADVVLRNDGTVDELRKQVLMAVSRL